MGARISTGSDSKQDYETPADFMAAVAKRFGPIAFDLAAHAGNAQSPNYFAPCTGPAGPMPLDTKAFGMDAFDHSWAMLSDSLFKREDGSKGLLWLNCEFNDIATWARRCVLESSKGANILLLTPAAVGANWFCDLIAGHGDVYLLNGRLSFIPGQTYNKDCMLTHFYQSLADRDATLAAPLDALRSQICVWDWRDDQILHLWELWVSTISQLSTGCPPYYRHELDGSVWESFDRKTWAKVIKGERSEGGGGGGGRPAVPEGGKGERSEGGGGGGGRPAVPEGGKELVGGQAQGTGG